MNTLLLQFISLYTTCALYSFQVWQLVGNGRSLSDLGEKIRVPGAVTTSGVTSTGKWCHHGIQHLPKSLWFNHREHHPAQWCHFLVIPEMMSSSQGCQSHTHPVSLGISFLPLIPLGMRGPPAGVRYVSQLALLLFFCDRSPPPHTLNYHRVVVFFNLHSRCRSTLQFLLLTFIYNTQRMLLSYSIPDTEWIAVMWSTWGYCASDQQLQRM